MLSITQPANLASNESSLLSFLEWLSAKPSREFMGLFSSTRQAAEKEVMIYQTIRGSVKNYYSTRQLSNQVALSPDSSLAQNSVAFKWLVENNYLFVSQDRCTLTQLAIAKLYTHFAKELIPLPIAISQGD